MSKRAWLTKIGVIISYQRNPENEQGEPVPPTGTDDAKLAKGRLRVALADHIVPTLELGEDLPSTDDVAFEQEAKTILREWFVGRPSDPDAGSVLSRLGAVGEQNNFPLQTFWQPDPTLRDKAYRDSVDAALENWLEWQSSVGMLGLTIDQVLGGTAAGSFAQSQTLVAAALRHAVDRVNLRCVARAQEYRDLHQAGGSTPADIQQRQDYLGRLILEGNAAFRYFKRGQQLELFQGIEVFKANPRLDTVVGDFCFQVEFDQEMTFLEGTPDNATLKVKTGLRVDGVDELLIPPITAPLVVRVTKLGDATIGRDFGRTDASGMFETSVNFGDSDTPQLLVDVVFNFDENVQIEDDRKLRVNATTYASQVETLGTEPEIKLLAALGGQDRSELRQSDIESVNGEYVQVVVELTRGRQPIVDSPVFVQILGGGQITPNFRETDGSGRARYAFNPPADQIGRTQIAVAYQTDGEVYTDTIFVDYTTDEFIVDGEFIGINRPYTKAQAEAAAKAGRHLAIVGLSNIVSSIDSDPNYELLASIQREWLTSGLDNAEEPAGLLKRIIDAAGQRDRAISAAVEYFRFREQITILGVDDYFADETDPQKDEFELRKKVVKLLTDAIDSYVDQALTEASADLAREALAIAAQVEPLGLLIDEVTNEGQPNERKYDFNSVKERLGYEIQVGNPEIHGSADNAIVQRCDRCAAGRGRRQWKSDRRRRP